MIRALLIAALALAAVAISPTAASALPCLSQAQAGANARYRQVDDTTRCWYRGSRTPSKAEFTIKAKAKPVKQPPPMPIYFDRAENHAGEAPAPSTLAADTTARASVSRRGEPAPVYRAESEVMSAPPATRAPLERADLTADLGLSPLEGFVGSDIANDCAEIPLSGGKCSAGTRSAGVAGSIPAQSTNFDARWDDFAQQHSPKLALFMAGYRQIRMEQP